MSVGRRSRGGPYYPKRKEKLMDEPQIRRRNLEIAYRTGAVSRGHFKRKALAQGWSPIEVHDFERKHKPQHKQARRRR